MISAPWLHHSTGETPGGLMENCTAVRLPICTAVRGGHGRVSKTAARVMTPKVNSKCHAACAPLVLLPHDNGPLWAQKSREHSFLTEAAVMISAPWLHHSTGETPGGLMEAVRLPAEKVPFLTRGWTAQGETAPRCASHSQSAPHRQAAERLPPALSATLWTEGLCTGAQSKGGVGGPKLSAVAAPAVREPRQGRSDCCVTTWPKTY